jgi:ketosteroid isomerase-like protein
MSEDNVKVVTEVVEAVFDRRDYDDAVRYFRPEAEWHNTGAFPGDQICCGPQAIVEFWESFMDVFQTQGGAVVENVAHADDVVVVQVHSRGFARGSRIPIDQRWAITFRIADGLIVRAEARGDYEKALAAAGL